MPQTPINPSISAAKVPPKTPSRTTTKSDAKSDSKPGPKPVTKPDEKPVAKPVGKSDTKPDIKPTINPDVKPTIDPLVKPVPGALSTDPPQNFAAMNKEQRQHWLETHASKHAPDVSLWEIYKGNKILNSNLKIVAGAINSVRTNIFDKRLTKDSSQASAVNAVFETLDVAIKAYSRAVYRAALDLQDTGTFRTHAHEEELIDPDATVDDTSPDALKKQILSILVMVESAAPFLQKRNIRLGVTYADIVNSLVEALGGLLVTLVFSNAIKPVSISGPSGERELTTIMSVQLESLHREILGNNTKSPEELDLTPIEE